MQRMPGVVARQRELAFGEHFLDSAGRRTSTLILEGEPGIGKTTLWREVVRGAEERGLRVLSCRPAETEAKFALSALVDLLETVSDESLAGLPDPQRRALEVALLRIEPASEPIEPRWLATAFRSVLDELSDNGPLLVAVDDLQWLDEASASVIQFALRRLGGRPIGWLFARRVAAQARIIPEELVPPESVTRVTIGPLNLAALQNVLKDRLEHAPTRPALVRIHRASAGNPLYALEIARELTRAGDITAMSSIPVPEDVRQLIAQRVARLPEATRDALLLASALFEPTTALVDEAALGPAEEADLIRIDGSGGIAFHHPLYASAVYGSVSRMRRRELHARLAELVSDAEERARHLALAAAEPDEETARALEEGAVVARARGAWESAAELLEQAARLSPPNLMDAARSRVVAAAEHHVRSGDRSRGRALLEQLLAQDLPSTQRAQALHLLAEISYNDDNFVEAGRLFREALGHTDDPRLASAVELGLGNMHASLMEFPGGSAATHRALELAERIEDRGLIAQALAHCAMLDFLCGEGVDWEKVERSLALEEADPRVPLHRRPSVLAASLLLYVGDHAEARKRLRALCETAIDEGDESDLAFVMLWLSWLETRSGDFTTSLTLAAEASSIGTLTGSHSMSGWALAQQAFVFAHQGKVAEARRYCEDAWTPVQRSGNLLPALWIAAATGLLELSLGNPQGAWQACEPLTQMAEQAGIDEPVVMFFLPEALEALIALGQLDRAEPLLERLTARGRELDRAWALATGGRCRALLLAARGELDAACVEVDRALTEHRRMDMPFERARALLVKGVIERRARQRARAKASLEEARAEFERLGAVLWADNAAQELTRLGMRRSSGDELTPSERRVAELAAAGLTNREVAAALFISPKTVEANLSKIYRKLAISSRAELGAYMAGSSQM